MHACAHTQMPEEGTGSPGTGITGDCEPTHVSVETPTLVL